MLYNVLLTCTLPDQEHERVNLKRWMYLGVSASRHIVPSLFATAVTQLEGMLYQQWMRNQRKWQQLCTACINKVKYVLLHVPHSRSMR